jgi:transposase
MSTLHDSTQVSRYVALDVHRNYVVVGAVDCQQHIVLSPCDFGFERFAAWANGYLKQSALFIFGTDNLSRIGG